VPDAVSTPKPGSAAEVSIGHGEVRGTIDRGNCSIPGQKQGLAEPTQPDCPAIGSRNRDADLPRREQNAGELGLAKPLDAALTWHPDVALPVLEQPIDERRLYSLD